MREKNNGTFLLDNSWKWSQPKHLDHDIRWQPWSNQLQTKVLLLSHLRCIELQVDREKNEVSMESIHSNEEVSMESIHSISFIHSFIRSFIGLFVHSCVHVPSLFKILDRCPSWFPQTSRTSQPRYSTSSTSQGVRGVAPGFEYVKVVECTNEGIQIHLMYKSNSVTGRVHVLFDVTKGSMTCSPFKSS